MAQNEASADAILNAIKGDLETLTSEKDAAIAEIEREYGQKIQGLNVAYDFYARKATVQGSDDDEHEPGADAPSRLPVNWLAQETLRFAAETGRFFHVNELDERLAVRLDEDFPDADQLVLQEKAGSRTLRKLWKRGEVARVTYGSHSRHYFHGLPELVRYGFDGPEFVSPHVTPPAEFLEGVEDEPPQFPRPE